MTSQRLEPPPSSLPPGSTVWAYLRDSGGSSQDRSVDQQREIILEYCTKHGLILSRPPFEDIHKSGTTTKGRDQFDLMMSLSASKEKPQGLIIWNFARFSRGGPYDSQLFKSLLRQRGIIIHSLTDRIPEGDFAPVIETIIDIANKQKADEAAMGAWRGLRHVVQQGAVPGKPPIGIQRIPIQVTSAGGITRTAHRWEPDPAYIPRIRKAFEMRAAGKSLVQIHNAVKLYKTINNYVTFFQNEIYIGTLAYGELRIEKYCKAIVPRKTWDQVQKIIAENINRKHMQSETNHPRRVSSTYILSSLLRCAKCGNMMNGMTSNQRNGSIYHRYRCHGAKIQRICTAVPIPAAVVENTVIEKIDAFFSKEENLISIMTRFQRDQAQHESQAKDQLASFSSELATVRKKLTHTVTAIENAGGSPNLLKRLKELEEQETDLLGRIERTQAERAQPIIVPSPEIARELAKRIHADLHHQDPAHVRQTLQGMVYEITAARSGRDLAVNITLMFGKKKVIDPTVSKFHAPVGAPIFRHSIDCKVRIPKRGRPVHKKPVM